MNWISITERLPDLGEEVEIMFKNGSVLQAKFCRNEDGFEYWFDGLDRHTMGVVEWRPIEPSKRRL